MSAGEVGLLILLGAVAFLDQWPAVQTMASRPLVTGTLAGWVLGAPGEGALWGAVFEAVYLGMLPIGAARYPDAGLAGLVGTAVALEGESAGVAPAGLAVAAGALAGLLGDRVSGFHRRWNGRTAARVRERVSAGDPSAIGRGIAGALARGAVLGAAAAAVALAIGLAGLTALTGTPWSGPLPIAWVRLAGVAAAAVAGLALFARAERGLVALGAGAACGAALARLAGAP
ncbi:MAG TPA: PTS sugar transporter subunit IIC [Gemmatimonadota bacterium]|nr:PTS sugar transporter subunit IIC [Gemmatimonadota bacterium]